MSPSWLTNSRSLFPLPPSLFPIKKTLRIAAHVQAWRYRCRITDRPLHLSSGTMFENLSLPHLLMVLAVAILVFGPKRIPEIAGSMGKGIREFKRHISEAGRPDSEESNSPPTNANERVSSREEESSHRDLVDSTESRTPKRLL